MAKPVLKMKYSTRNEQRQWKGLWLARGILVPTSNTVQLTVMLSRWVGSEYIYTTSKTTHCYLRTALDHMQHSKLDSITVPSTSLPIMGQFLDKLQLFSIKHHRLKGEKNCRIYLSAVYKTIITVCLHTEQ